MAFPSFEVATDGVPRSCCTTVIFYRKDKKTVILLLTAGIIGLTCITSKYNFVLFTCNFSERSCWKTGFWFAGRKNCCLHARKVPFV